MRSLSDERGSVVVLTALAFTALTGMVAFVARYGETATQNVEVQSAVDAASLAIAEDCAVAAPGCSATGSQATLRSFLDTAVNTGTSRIDSVSVDLATRKVVVRATAVDTRADTEVAGSATSGWAPAAPVDFCDYAALVTTGTSGAVSITFDATGGDPRKVCENRGLKGPDEYIDEYFEYSKPSVLCELRWAVSGGSGACTEAVLRTFVGKEISLPIFRARHNEKWQQTGTRRATLTGYRVGPGWTWPPSAPPCTGTLRCVQAIFLDNKSPSQAAQVRLEK